MYKLMAGLSVFIRTYLLPNPFESFEYGVLINYAIEPLLHLVTFFIVGLFYNRGSAPAFGSFLYLSFYCINVGLIQLWAKFGATPIVGAIIVSLYIAAIITISNRRSRFIF